MKGLLCVLVTLLLAACGAAPQQQVATEEGEGVDMCELLAFYELAQYRDDIDDEAKSNYKMLAESKKPLFPDCQEITEGAVPGVEMPVRAVMEEDKWVELEEVGCRAIVNAHGNFYFAVSVIGEGLQGLAADVYFPGESQAVEMDMITTAYTPDTGDPLRAYIVPGRVFPLGAYYFDVHVDDQSLRLRWNRKSKVYRAFSLDCPDRPPRPADLPMIVEEGVAHQFADASCSLSLNHVGENFNSLVSGDYNDTTTIDVILPGETAPALFDGELIDVLQGRTREFPFRRHWLEGEDFPDGTYDIRVTFEGVEYRFAWDRTSSEYDSIHVQCLNQEA